MTAEHEHVPVPEKKGGGWLDRVVLLFVLVYCALPDDIIPHEAGVIGHIDDFSLIAGVLAYLWKSPGGIRDSGRAGLPDPTRPPGEKPQ